MSGLLYHTYTRNVELHVLVTILGPTVSFMTGPRLRGMGAHSADPRHDYKTILRARGLWVTSRYPFWEHTTELRNRVEEEGTPGPQKSRWCVGIVLG